MNSGQKRVGIMQPYLFPYIGYWQLMYAVDEFVVLDDVNFIVRGWINRNNILLNGNKHLFTFPIKNLSQNTLIMDAEFGFAERDIKKFLSSISAAYKKAPYYKDVFPVLEQVLGYGNKNVSDFIINSFAVLLAYLGIKKNILRSSQIHKNINLTGEDRILALCKALDAAVYINPIGGTELYHRQVFKENHLELFFLQTGDYSYKQFGDEFVPHLSVIDILMFNSVETVKNMLLNYSLI